MPMEVLYIVDKDRGTTQLVLNIHIGQQLDNKEINTDYIAMHTSPKGRWVS